MEEVPHAEKRPRENHQRDHSSPELEAVKDIAALVGIHLQTTRAGQALRVALIKLVVLFPVDAVAFAQPVFDVGIFTGDGTAVAIDPIACIEAQGIQLGYDEGLVDELTDKAADVAQALHHQGNFSCKAILANAVPVHSEKLALYFRHRICFHATRPVAVRLIDHRHSTRRTLLAKLGAIHRFGVEIDNETFATARLDELFFVEHHVGVHGTTSFERRHDDMQQSAIAFTCTGLTHISLNCHEYPLTEMV